MRMDKLDPTLVEDRVSRENFKIIKDALVAEPVLKAGFRLFEVAFTAAGTFKIAHGLGFQPKDVLQSSLIGAGAVTWNYDKFDAVNLDITVTDACTVRAFIGAYRN